MNRRSICRWCKYYRPDERYRGKMGWCDRHDHPSMIGETCVSMTEGAQKWLCGEDVKEND